MKAGEFYIETCRGEDASIASLHSTKNPDAMDNLIGQGPIVPTKGFNINP